MKKNEFLVFFFHFQGYASKVQVRINKIDDLGAKTAFKTMNFQNIQY